MHTERYLYYVASSAKLCKERTILFKLGEAVLRIGEQELMEDLSATGYPQEPVLAVSEKNKRPPLPKKTGEEDTANLITAGIS